MISELPSMEDGPSNWRIFVFLNRVCKIGARAGLLEALEGRPRVVPFSFSTFPLKCSGSCLDNSDPIGLKFAPILVSSGRLDLHGYLEEMAP